eukprot:6783851-Lingulodinium_polyedra.AAC.1
MSGETVAVVIIFRPPLSQSSSCHCCHYVSPLATCMPASASFGMCALVIVVVARPPIVRSVAPMT